MGLKIFEKFLLSILLITANFESGVSDLLEKASEFRNVAEKIDAKETLNHGDHCNYSDELEKTRVAQGAIKLLSAPTEENVDLIINQITGLLNTRRNFCDSKRLLGCAENSGRCECGPVTEGYTYVLEEGQCHWALGSECSITELQDGEPIEGMAAKCQENSQCVIERNGKECHVRNMRLERIHEFPCVCKASSSGPPKTSMKPPFSTPSPISTTNKVAERQNNEATHYPKTNKAPAAESRVNVGGDTDNLGKSSGYKEKHYFLISLFMFTIFRCFQ